MPRRPLTSFSLFMDSADAPALSAMPPPTDSLTSGKDCWQLVVISLASASGLDSSHAVLPCSHRGAVVPETTYTYDRVLGPESTQADMYEAAVAPVIADVMNGYNGTIMAYGQTGAGKTHTLSSIQPDNIGMMPRAAAEVFVQANSDPSHDYVVLMSYVQIYMELIQDLLRPESENLVGNGSRRRHSGAEASCVRGWSRRTCWCKLVGEFSLTERVG